MMQQVRDFLRVPPELLAAFQQDTLQKNRLALVVISIMIFGMELFNMARVLFWSTSGLGTLNNQIYFGMYCSLWLSAALTLLLQRLLRHASVRAQLAVQLGATFFFLLWHVCLNTYDLLRNPDTQTSIFTTAVLALAVFIQMPSWFSALAYGTAYILFMALAGPILADGPQLNLTFTTIVALAVSLTRCHQTVIMIAQRQEIHQMNLQLQVLLQKDPLTGLLNKTAFQDQVTFHLEQLEALSGVTLLIVDLDNFKSVNDRFGHPCGDYVLQETALRLQAVFPEATGIGRIGGDEFAAVFAGQVDPGRLESACQQLIRSATGIAWQDQVLGVSCSIGIGRAKRPGISYEVLYQEADQALYGAKRGGKGCFRLQELA